MILFCDEAKQAKLEEAIRRGYIIRHQDRDGILRYELTTNGANQWLLEKVLQNVAGVRT